MLVVYPGTGRTPTAPPTGGSRGSTLGGMSLICVSIFVDSPDDVPTAIERASEAVKEGARMIEWRLDAVAEDPDGLPAVVELLRGSPAPCIATIRAETEGGTWDGEERDRISMLEAMGTSEHPPAYLDLEQTAWRRSADLRRKVRLAIDHEAQIRDIASRLIISSHDFGGRPANLLARVAEMVENDACAVGKIVFTARSVRDNLEVFDLLAERRKPMIALCMGEFGEMSRVLAPKFGGFLTFTASDARSTTAPGQLTTRELREVFRFEAIKSSTRVYGLVGHPVGHSRSPILHNRGFDAVGHDGVYVRMPVAPGWESLKASLLQLIEHPRLDFAGCSVTHPHKEDLVRFVREIGGEIDEISDRIGAANTLVVDAAGTVRCRNTDVGAAVHSFAEGSGRAIDDLRGMRIAVFGAGGVGRAVVYGLIEAGAEVEVFNRTAARGEALVKDLEAWGRVGFAGSADGFAPADFDGLVHCTPAGMQGGSEPEASCVPRGVDLPDGFIVMDTVYAPRRTPLLEIADSQDARTIEGIEMFRLQAEAQFAAWTGRSAPSGLFGALLTGKKSGST